MFKLIKRISFSTPKFSDIVFFDNVNISELKNIIESNYTFTIIKRRPPHYYISFLIIKSFMLSLKHIDLSQIINNPRGILIGFLSQLRFIYYRSLIVLLNPKAVITFIDNNLIFNQLSKELNFIPFIAIQNGLRLPHENASNYHVQHLFSFGFNEKEYFSKIGYQVENFHPSGSIQASSFLRRNISSNLKYDILIVSSWRGNIGYPIDQVDTMNSMRVMDNLFFKYLNQKKLKVAVILRNERNGPHWYVPELNLNEEQYYKEIYGDKVIIIDVDFKSRNIYDLINKSKLIVSGFSTTVLLEAYGAKKKIMYYNFTDKDIYHSIFNDLIVSKKSDYNSFSKQLDELIEISQNDYIKIHSSNMKHYMSFPKNYDIEASVSTKIKKIIKKNEKNSSRFTK
tara:strand:+ start:6989 stop:8179 length:1191 start_codon:yes stop_codon:yes gene_type:complete